MDMIPAPRVDLPSLVDPRAHSAAAPADPSRSAITAFSTAQQPARRRQTGDWVGLWIILLASPRTAKSFPPPQHRSSLSARGFTAPRGTVRWYVDVVGLVLTW